MVGPAGLSPRAAIAGLISGDGPAGIIVRDIRLPRTLLAALELAFWLLGSLEDRSTDHLMIAAPFMIASWVLLAVNARAFRALTLGEDAAASLGVEIGRTRMMVVIGVALGVGAAVAVA